MFSTLPHFQAVHPLEQVKARARACLDLTPNASLARGATVQTYEICISFVSPQQMLLLAAVLHQARVSMQLPLPRQLSQKRNGRYLPAHPSTPPCRFPEVRAPSSIQHPPSRQCPYGPQRGKLLLHCCPVPLAHHTSLQPRYSISRRMNME